ncbi:MAG: TIGR03435 family protein [Candidatus Sulfopaludibacter sp.]|nr:TIGR03435 family protein [Candidatus Sulfopaludibacter sp.]
MAVVYGAACAQTPDARAKFEVASVKPAGPSEQTGGPRRAGGPRSPDPTRFVCDRCTLSDMLVSAFHILPDQISGPVWLDGDRFTINAKVPPGTTPEQLRLMQQNLLEERFNLKWHREAKQASVSELAIAKGGPKMKPSTGEPAGSQEPGASIEPNGRVSARYANLSMEEFAAILSRLVRQPVTNATGLTAKYDFTLSWAMEGMALPGSAPSSDSGPTIFAALQEQLGLKLEQKKGPVDRIVIDHIDKAPSEN